VRRYLASAALLLGAPALAVPSVPAAQHAADTERPNVVLIVTDDMRYDDLEYMPEVQRLLVDRGVSFSRFYSQNPLCCPARTSILRGQYSHTTGVMTNGGDTGGFHAFDDRQSLPVWLTGDYTTGLVGKYLNGYGSAPRSRTYIPPGWDSWQASLGKRTYDYLDLRYNLDGRVNDVPGTYSTTFIGDKSDAFLANQAEPFFLYSAFVAPHVGRPREADDPRGLATPHVHPKYRDTYAGPRHPLDPSFNEADTSDKRPAVRDNPPLTRRQRAKIAESYAQRRESLRSVDDQVGRMLETLRARGVLERTYVIFMSDNGYLAGEHRIFNGKGLPYTPASHVPLVIRGPGIAAATTDDTLTMTPDLAPTILALTGERSRVPEGYAFDGVDVFSRLADARPAVVLETGGSRRNFAFRGIVTSDGWKYNVFPDPLTEVDEVEMYDLNTDPYELQNLAYDPKYNNEEAHLATLYKRYRSCSGAECR
jgi:arylsulfatase A-like enzyme